MKTFSKFVPILLISFLFALTVSAKGFVVDVAHTTVGFQVRHLVIAKVTGKFNTFKATVDFNEKTKKLRKVTAVIDVASVSTGIEKRDKHLRSPDFFNADKYPKIKFKSTKIKKNGNNYDVYGKLTIRGITKAVVLKGEINGVIKDKKFGTRAAFSGKLVINRQDFDVKWNKTMEAGGVVVSNEVIITIDAEILKK